MKIKKINEKGGIKINLKTFIEIVIGTILIILLIVGLMSTGIVQGHFGTVSSAQKIGDAVKKVSLCIDEQGSDCNLQIEVDVILPQAVKKNLLNDEIRGDPMWVIYHDTNLRGEKTNTDRVPDKTQAAPPISSECQDLWDPEDVNPDKCKNKLCYGMIEQAGGFKKIEGLEESMIKKLRPFWIADPCYARVIVRPTANAKEGCSNCIEVCYTGTQNIPFSTSEWQGSEFNFCHYDDDKDDSWPDKNDAWSDLHC